MIIAKDVNHIRRTHLLVFVFFLFSQFCSYLSLCAVVLQGKFPHCYFSFSFHFDFVSEKRTRLPEFTSSYILLENMSLLLLIHVDVKYY